METAVQTREEVPPVAEINPSASKGLDRRALGRAASNLGVAAIFFLSLASQAREYHGLTDLHDGHAALDEAATSHDRRPGLAELRDRGSVYRHDSQPGGATLSWSSLRSATG